MKLKNKTNILVAFFGLTFAILAYVAYVRAENLSSQGSKMSDAAATNWLTSYSKALDAARQEKKTVLMDFTGSDWCIWCMRLRSEVFATVEFQNYAATNLVLMEVDFPHRKPQSDFLKKQNEELMQKFGVEGFPTIIILNSEGKALGKMGYVPGGPAAFISQLKAITEK